MSLFENATAGIEIPLCTRTDTEHGSRISVLAKRESRPKLLLFCDARCGHRRNRPGTGDSAGASPGRGDQLQSGAGVARRAEPVQPAAFGPGLERLRDA